MDEVGANLAAFTLNHEDVSILSEKPPVVVCMNWKNIENEIRYLRIFASDFAITKVFDKTPIKRQALSNAFLIRS